MKGFVIAFGLFLASTLCSQAQTLKIDDISLNVVEGNKLELLIDKIPDTIDTTRIIHVNRILSGPNDKKYDVTDVTLGNNDYNLTWDGIEGVYEMKVTTIRNGKTVVKTGLIKFI